ncbi:MAG: pentapeptide repeat-containing protein [Anaerolineales bacterium]
MQIPRLLALIGCDVFANLEEEELSTVPSNWDEEGGSLARVKGASLDQAKLEYMAARGAILPRAHLRNASLRGADFQKAILCGADLSGADFTGAELRGADLQGVQNWRQVRSVKRARIGKIRNAPDGFTEWALRRGATE